MIGTQRFLGFLFVLVTAVAYGHPGGHDNEQPIDQKQASVLADNVVVTMMKGKQLDAAWQERQYQSTKTRKLGQHQLWVISYKNPAINDATKQNLYIFLTPFGDFVDANHTGKLIGEK